MIKRPLLSVLLLCLALAGWMPSQGWADQNRQTLAPERVQKGRRDPPPGAASRAGETARQQTGGRVLGVEPRQDGFRVRVLTPDGEVRHLLVPER